MSMNDEFELGDDLGLGGGLPVIPKNSRKKVARSEPIEEVVEIDPEDDRENWPTIQLETEEGKPNYEFLSAHGTKRNGVPFDHDLQVMRGVDVKVPPSIVYALQDAVAEHGVQRRDPVSGRMQMVMQKRSSIPWRLVRGGKYI